jgi:thiamine-monophosphate kinase
LREFDLIARILAPLATHPGAFGLTDDAAAIAAPPGALVLTADAIVAGVHFLPGDPPDSIGHKALAVNLSDLAAKGATPFGYLLTLSLPAGTDRAWLESFAQGLGALQRDAGMTLLGGDTTSTPGPLSVAITALGLAPAEGMVRRSGGAPGDLLYVTGTIGDGALGLGVARDPQQAARWSVNDDGARQVIERYRRPTPRLGAVETLRRHAAAAIDVSDGLVGDLDKLCAASGVGAAVEAASAPLSAPAIRACQAQPGLLGQLLTGGDDYEILAAVHPDHAQAFEAGLAAAAIPCAMIGRLLPPGDGVTIIGPDGAPMRFASRAFEHFGGNGT